MKSEFELEDPLADEEVKHPSDIIGEWGPFQRRAVIIITMLYLVAPFQNMGIIFYTPKLNFWCKPPPGFENATRQTCESYEDPNKPCTEFEYDMDGFRSTIIDEFDLVCDRSWLVSSSKSIFQLGYMISSVLFGVLSDRFGRLRAKKWAIMLEIVAGLGQAFSMNITQFLIARLFLGIASWARFLTGALLIIEIVGPSYRASMRVVNEIGWCGGLVIMPCVMYFVQHFRYVQIGVAIYEVIFIYFIWQLPESPRWQLTHGQYAGAEKTIIAAAAENRTFNEQEVKDKLVKLKKYIDDEEHLREMESKKNITDLWKVPSLAKICAIQYVIWCFMGFAAYGFGYSSGDLGGSIFLNVLMQGLGNMTSLAVLWFLVDRFGRKTIGGYSFILNSFCVFALIPVFFVDNNRIYILVLVFVGTFFNGGGWQLVYQLSAELFPTTLRQIGVGSCSVSGRIGSTLAPFIKELTDRTHISVSMAFIGGITLCQGLLVLLLPETKGIEIPDTIAEAKILNKKKKENAL